VKPGPERAGVVPPVKPSGPEVSISKEDVGAVRKWLHLDELPEPLRQSTEQWAIQAREKGMVDDALHVAQKAVSEGRSLDPVEAAGAAQKQGQLIDEIAANPSVDLLEQLHALNEATDAAGTIWGRSGVARQITVKVQTQELAIYLAEARKNKGIPLTEKEIAGFKGRHARIIELEKALDAEKQKSADLAAERDKVIAERVSAAEIRRAKISQRTVALRDKLAAERTQLKKQLAAMGNRVNSVVGPPPDALYALGKMAVNYIRDGATSLNEVVAKLKQDFPTLLIEMSGKH